MHILIRARFLLLAACLAGSVAAQAATQFKIATVAPEGSQWMQDLRAASTEISAATEGRIVIKFYAGGVMGNDKKVLRKMRIGQLQGGAFTANGLADSYPDILLYGLPLIFENQAEVDYVREQMDAQLARGLEEAGLVSFGFAGGGFANLMGSMPVTQLDQLRGRKAWIPEGDRVAYAVMEAMNLSPVVLPITDVLTGLQTGLIEFVATPPVGAVVLQWHTKVKYVTDAPLVYTLGALVVEAKAFERLDPADQAIFRQVMGRVYAEIDERSRDDNDRALKALVSSGLEVTALSAEQFDSWQAAGEVAIDQLVAEGVVSKALYLQLQTHLSNYRNGAGADRPAATVAE